MPHEVHHPDNGSAATPEDELWNPSGVTDQSDKFACKLAHARCDDVLNLLRRGLHQQAIERMDMARGTHTLLSGYLLSSGYLPEGLPTIELPNHRQNAFPELLRLLTMRLETNDWEGLLATGTYPSYFWKFMSFLLFDGDVKRALWENASVVNSMIVACANPPFYTLPHPYLHTLLVWFREAPHLGLEKLSQAPHVQIFIESLLSVSVDVVAENDRFDEDSVAECSGGLDAIHIFATASPDGMVAVRSSSTFLCCRRLAVEICSGYHWALAPSHFQGLLWRALQIALQLCVFDEELCACTLDKDFVTVCREISSSDPVVQAGRPVDSADIRAIEFYAERLTHWIDFFSECGCRKRQVKLFKNMRVKLLRELKDDWDASYRSGRNLVDAIWGLGECRDQRIYCSWCDGSVGANTVLQKCAGCGLARYCSKTCQKLHWKHHKALCRNFSSKRSPRRC